MIKDLTILHNMNKDLTPRNDKGQPHGYWCYFWTTDNMRFKGTFYNGARIGYWEWYDTFGNRYAKAYYII